MPFKTLEKIIEKSGQFLSKGKNIFLPMAIIIIFELLFRPDYPGRQTLVDDWTNVIYVSFYYSKYSNVLFYKIKYKPLCNVHCRNTICVYNIYYFV
jgi:hypothetical protein